MPAVPLLVAALLLQVPVLLLALLFVAALPELLAVLPLVPGLLLALLFVAALPALLAVLPELLVVLPAPL